jgi:hypothetical protein
VGLSMRGNRAEVRLGYQVAAVLGEWDFRMVEEGGFEVDAMVETSNPVYLAKSPLALDLPQGRKTLRFHNVTIQDLGQRMKVRGTERPEQR